MESVLWRTAGYTPKAAAAELITVIVRPTTAAQSQMSKAAPTRTVISESCRRSLNARVTSRPNVWSVSQPSSNLISDRPLPRWWATSRNVALKGVSGLLGVMFNLLRLERAVPHRKITGFGPHALRNLWPLPEVFHAALSRWLCRFHDGLDSQSRRKRRVLFLRAKRSAFHAFSEAIKSRGSDSSALSGVVATATAPSNATRIEGRVKLSGTAASAKIPRAPRRSVRSGSVNSTVSTLLSLVHSLGRRANAPQSKAGS